MIALSSSPRFLWISAIRVVISATMRRYSGLSRPRSRRSTSLYLFIASSVCPAFSNTSPAILIGVVSLMCSGCKSFARIDTTSSSLSIAASRSPPMCCTIAICSRVSAMSRSADFSRTRACSEPSKNLKESSDMPSSACINIATRCDSAARDLESSILAKVDWKPDHTF